MSESYLKIKNATNKGYLEATVGDGIDISSRMQYHRGNVQKDSIQTLDCTGGEGHGVVVKNLKQKLCDQLIETNQVSEGDVIKHSYTQQILDGKKKCVEKSDGIMITLTTRCDCVGTAVKDKSNNLRIRKLTPKECWRLMGFEDEDYERASKVNTKSQLYKQAGNSIVVNVLEEIIKELNIREHIKLLELFGGIGCCTQALKKLNVDFEIADYVEIDKYAVKSYNAMNDTNFEPQDITNWDKNIDVDFIIHGSPCQDFSLAGLQAGGDEGSGTRSSLMYETIRIVEKLKPKYVIWENVKNLLSKKHRHNFDAYFKKMEQLGYKNYYQVLNAKDYGIPQNRERVFTISILDNHTEKDEKISVIVKDFKFPEKKELKIKLKDMLEEEVDESFYLTEDKIEICKKVGHIPEWHQRGGIYDEDGLAPTICATDYKTPKLVSEEVKVNRLYGVFDTEKQKHQAGSVYDKNGLSPTLDTMQGGYRQPCIETLENEK